MREIRSLLNVEEYGVSLDWVTFSSVPGHAGTSRFRAFSEDVMKRREDTFPLRTKAYIKDYAGYSIGGFTLVQRARDNHLQMWASGEDTQTLVQEVLEDGLECRCKRIDIAVTARAKKTNSEYPRRLKNICDRKRKESGCESLKAGGIFNDKVSFTGCTFGRRGSAKHGRVYDWEAKHLKRNTGIVFRHELELRKIASERFWEQWLATKDKKQLELATCYYEFKNWRAPVEWMGDAGINKVSATAPETTDDSRLIHLDKSVLVFISNLIKSGRESEVRAAIKRHGLDHLFSP